MYITSERKEMPTSSGFKLAQGYLAYVGDNSNFGVASPLAGYRFRFEVGQYIGAIRMSSFTGDYRKYFRPVTVTLANRNVYVGRFGRDAENGGCRLCI